MGWSEDLSTSHSPPGEDDCRIVLPTMLLDLSGFMTEREEGYENRLQKAILHLLATINLQDAELKRS